jgi:hypothetical protein
VRGVFCLSDPAAGRPAKAAPQTNRSAVKNRQNYVAAPTLPESEGQFPMEITMFCGPLVPPNEKVNGTVSLAATLGTTTLN